MTVSNDIHTDYQLSAGRFTQGGLRRMDTNQDIVNLLLGIEKRNLGLLVLR